VSTAAAAQATTAPPVAAPVAPAVETPQIHAAPLPVNDTSDQQLSNNNYYVNSSGNTVHSPAYAPSQPAGSTAQCRDGTYSFSQHRSGTCSHHGGVAEWL